ncbi:hypothetical protein PIROE2DRAFT_15770 [Piromyces sp. E2]|nr:hypothetical protein PIROE2DRAFT_15770 [Piromyces sp. E2]|eukprot:OUM58869.1 hypothetical protein PIROE2DRAFT_15770 [Piromyces sp. E2]
MEYENNQPITTIEEDNEDEKLLKTKDCNVADTDIPGKIKSRYNSVKDNTEGEKPSILQQFHIPKVYLMAICGFSILSLILPFFKFYKLLINNRNFDRNFDKKLLEAKLKNKMDKPEDVLKTFSTISREVSMEVNNKKIEKIIKAKFKRSYEGLDIYRNIINNDILIPIIYFCVLGPIIEEFLFRYLIFGLFKKYGQKIKKDNLFKGQLVMVFACILTSLLFSFGHFSVEEKDLIFINITYYRF